MQLATWKKTPLAMNTAAGHQQHRQPRSTRNRCTGGAWVRSDSIIVEEPIQIEELANRPPWLAAILEDGYFRSYDVSKLTLDAAGVNELEELYASCPRSESELLVALDRVRASGQLQRALSSRIRAIAHPAWAIA